MAKCAICKGKLATGLKRKEKMSTREIDKVKELHDIDNIPENTYIFHYKCHKCKLTYFPKIQNKEKVGG